MQPGVHTREAITGARGDPSTTNVSSLHYKAAAQLAARSLCMPEDRQLARLSKQNSYATARTVCNERAGELDGLRSAVDEMVPRDRIELPTRGFSIRCSTN